MSRRRRTLRFPSYRNLQIYHQLAWHRRSQAAVATELGISQVRVSQIGQQVQTWVDCLVDPKHYLAEPGKRFHLAIAHERIRLHDAYDPLFGLLDAEREDPLYLRRYIAVVNGEPLNTLEISEKPDFRLYYQTLDVSSRLAELEAIANLGPFAHLPGEFQQTITHRYVGRASGRPLETSGLDQNTFNSPSNASVIPSNAASSASVTPSNPASNGSISPSNAAENRGQGVLTSSPPATKSLTQPIATQPLTSHEAFASASQIVLSITF